jgi:hypothetical protein
VIVGWQDRDWAKLRDEELEALYGFRKPAAGRTVSHRKIVWSTVAVLVVAVFGFASTQMPHANAPGYGVNEPEPDVIYGAPTELTGQLGVCTDMSVDLSGTWQCISVDLNTRHLRVARPAPYDGPCGHLSADQTTGRWVCVSARPDGTAPLPAGQSS